MYAKDPYETKYQFLSKKRESIGLKHFNDPKAFTEYSNDIQDVYKNIEKYNLSKTRKILIVLMIWLLIWLIIKKLNSIVTELFIRGNKLNISAVFITQSYLKVPKDVIMKIPNKYRPPEPLIINILCGWSRIYGYFELCSVLFSLV